MKFRIQASDLVAALARLKGIISRKTTLPVLGGVLIEVKDGHLSMTGTDLDALLSLQVPAEIEQEGACVAPCARLAASVTKIDGDELEITLKKGKLQVIGEGMQFSLFVLDGAEFPGFAPLPATAVALQPKPGAWAKALGTVAPFMSDEETRMTLCGACIASEGGDIRIVATDGRRLAAATVMMEVPPVMTEGIIPAGVVRMAVCGDGGGVKTVRVSDDAIEMIADSWRLVTRKIAGSFPNWRQVIPPVEDSQRTFTVNREKLIEALVFAQTMCSEKANSVKFSAQTGDVLMLSANIPDVGENQAKVQARVKGPPIDVAYQPNYALDVLRAISAEEVTFGMRDEMSPCRVEEPGTIAVLMPMRING